MCNSQQPLLSDGYRLLNRELHLREPTYGTTGRQYVHLVRQLAHRSGARHILDYGCGKCDLCTALSHEFDIRNFDPALPGLDSRPAPSDFVACIDVLEHVEPEYLENVVADLVRVTVRAGLFTIATRAANKRLPDGSNCHRLVKDAAWWLDQLEGHFRIAEAECLKAGDGLRLVVESLRE